MGAARRRSPSWHAAAERASFDPYEPDTDEYRWAGGFSEDGSHIGVCGTVDGHAVCVDTASPQRTMPADLEQRARINELFFHHLMTDETDLSLPYRVAVEREDRRIRLGSEEVRNCEGMRIRGGSRWVGMLTVDDLRVTITAAGPTGDLSIRICHDAGSLPSAPPPHG